MKEGSNLVRLLINIREVGELAIFKEAYVGYQLISKAHIENEYKQYCNNPRKHTPVWVTQYCRNKLDKITEEANR